MTLEEQTHVVVRNVHTDISEAVLDVESCDRTDVVDVEHAESVMCVEVGASYSLIFGTLHISIETNLLSDHVCDSG